MIKTGIFLIQIDWKKEDRSNNAGQQQKQTQN
jgi:hypothetical protein